MFVGLTAPDVLCPDRRNRVLPLLFARPLLGRDYVAAKVGAIGAIVFAFGFLPQAVLFIGQLLVSNAALDYLRDNAAVLWQVPVAVAMLALYYASLSLAVASFTTRRVIAAAALLIILLVSSAFSAILGGNTTDAATAGLGLGCGQPAGHPSVRPRPGVRGRASSNHRASPALPAAPPWRSAPTWPS